MKDETTQGPEIKSALLAGVIVFQIPINGSIGLLYLLSLLFMLSCLGIGTLVSTVARNQRQAMQMAFFFIFPSILLSGFVFPREAMPPSSMPSAT
ncbi:ABC transporter permease [Calderihabitans maritimus]|uniref:ABC-type multidrug transport system, permease component n=1 Tax=Calderihabitans maritimus TaxID=1246530 RepID=A0A1Z5HRP9_9FIRM|nr:ABC transporter permease [Calderihabitans maritimus]GAW92199.1 ABC-type multidrug transport system, permease component [Calderihabitans maritimus]